MKDETIAPIRYRTARGDRVIPLVLGLSGVASGPLLAWGAGPFLWPWGAAAVFLAGLAAVVALRRWWTARETVVWSGSSLELRRGNRGVILDADALTRVDVRPSSIHTLLEAGPLRWKLSHRIVRFDELLERLRLRRPDLFEVPGDTLRLRNSWVSSALQVALAAGTGAAGWVVWGWLPWLGVFFLTAAAYTFLRVWLFIPQAYEIGSETLVVKYWVRRKTWRKPQVVREDAYAAGGAVFFRMRFEFGSRSVVLDEGQLRQPLRPRAEWIVSRLSPSNHG